MSVSGDADLPRRIVRTAFASEQAIYGVILVAGMIVVAGAHDDSSWTVFLTVMGTIFVFWAAHVYAGTVAHHGIEHGRVIGLGEAFLMAVRGSAGLLASALVPGLILLLGATRTVSDDTAIWFALWVDIAILYVLGYVAFARRGSSLPVRILGGFGTALFGVAMILLKAFVH